MPKRPYYHNIGGMSDAEIAAEKAKIDRGGYGPTRPSLIDRYEELSNEESRRKENARRLKAGEPPLSEDKDVAPETEREYNKNRRRKKAKEKARRKADQEPAGSKEPSKTEEESKQLELFSEKDDLVDIVGTASKAELLRRAIQSRMGKKTASKAAERLAKRAAQTALKRTAAYSIPYLGEALMAQDVFDAMMALGPSEKEEAAKVKAENKEQDLKLQKKFEKALKEGYVPLPESPQQSRTEED